MDQKQIIAIATIYADQVRTIFSPRQIILYGSYASEAATENSDLLFWIGSMETNHSDICPIKNRSADTCRIPERLISSVSRLITYLGKLSSICISGLNSLSAVPSS